MNKLWAILSTWLILATSAVATTYYVSPTGSDTADGLTVNTAWLSMDNGDDQKIMQPGDTVLVLPGFYLISSGYSLLQSGTPSQPIVYRRFGKGEVRMEGNSTANAIVQLGGKNLTVEGFHLTNAKDDGVVVLGDSCAVLSCFIESPGKRGIRNDGNDCLFYRNVIAFAGDDGIKNEDAAKRGNRYYHNTIYQPDKHGIEVRTSVEECRIINCVIIESGDNGILGPSGTVCAFNNVWGSLNGDYDGVVDSAGGISSPPHFVDPDNQRFDLRTTADEIDAGTDIGFRFNGAAPDMGAFEKYNTYFVSPDGDDANDGFDSVSAWRTIDNGDSLLYPGDTVYVLAGSYADQVKITDSAEVGDPIVYAGIRDSTLVNGSGDPGILVIGEHLIIDGFSVTGSGGTGIFVTGSDNTISQCRTDSCEQYGIYLESAASTIVEHSVVTNSGVAGIVADAGGVRILNCTFVDNGDFDVDAIAADGLQLINGIFVGGDASLAAVRAPASATVRHCEFHDHATTLLGGAIAGTGCFSADPQFLDASTGIYRLQATSPSIDIGEDIGLAFEGPAPDIGAYETGIPAAFAIVPEPDSMVADSQYQFSVEATDALGYPAKPGAITWSHTFLSGSISVSGLFTPRLTGTGRIVAISTTYGLADTTVVLQVVPGELSALEISPDCDTVSADSTINFVAIGTDSLGNEIADPGALTWSVINDIGAIDGGGVFSATHAGSGFVRAVSGGGIVGISDTIVVIPGEIAFIDVQPSMNIITQYSSHQYYVLGYDSDSNLVQDLTSLSSWSTTYPGDPVDSLGLFSAGFSVSPPTYWVKADWDGFSDSGAVSVLFAGALAYVRIEYAGGGYLNDTLTTTDNDTTTVYARGYAAGGILLGGVACTWSIIGVDSIGTAVTTKGTSTRLQLTRVGTGRVVATYSGTMADTSGEISCQPGIAASVKILPDTAVSVSADSTFSFADEYFDADGNVAAVYPISTWSVLGSIGEIDLTGELTPQHAGIGYAVVTAGSMADTSAAVTVVPGALTHIVVSPDSASVSVDSTLQFVATGYDAKDNPRDPGIVSWQLTEPIGLIDDSGYFEPTSVSSARVIASSDLGPVDTSAIIEVKAGALAALDISPDSLEISSDSVVTFSVAGFDSKGNSVVPSKVSWSTVFGLGDINSGGYFEPFEVGLDRIVARCVVGTDTIADTTKAVVIGPGELDRLSVTPSTAILGIGDSLQFSTIGYDRHFNITDAGTIDWTVTGGIGAIDSTGLFIAGASGNGQVTATSEETGVSGITDLITVEALRVSSVALWNQTVHPNDSLVVLLKCRLENDFSRTISVDSLAVRSALSGAGTAGELLTNVDTVGLYIDTDDDSQVGVGDSLLAMVPMHPGVIGFDFDSIPVGPQGEVSIIVTADVALYAGDSDSLDFYIMPHDDIRTSDSTAVESADSLNSSGMAVIDGMVTKQIALLSRDFDSLMVDDSLFYLASLDLPRDGYRADTLKVINIANEGSASELDVDSIVLFADDGDGQWGGAYSETRVAKLVFTGSQWTRTGVSQPLTNQLNRFYLAAGFSRFARNGASVFLSIPQNGIGVSSGNDGPIDADLSATDSVIILTDQKLEVSALPLEEHSLTPGSNTGPLLGLRMSNGTEGSVTVQALTLNFTGTDPDGASQDELDSQIDSVGLYLAGDADFGSIGSADNLLATAEVIGGSVSWPDLDVSIPAADGVVNLLVTAWLSLTEAKNGNNIGFSLVQAVDIAVNPEVNVAGAFPIQSELKYITNAFPAAAIVFIPTGTGSVFGGEKNQLALNMQIPSNGYAADTVNTLKIVNEGTVIDGVITGMHLYADLAPSGFGDEDKLLSNMLRIGDVWIATGLHHPVPVGGTSLLVTVDISNLAFQGGTLDLGIPVSGLSYTSGMTGPDDTVALSNEHILIFAPNRVTAVSLPLGTSIIHPGASEETLLAFALYNGYVGESRHLNRVSLTNTTISHSDVTWADHTVGQMRLYYDNNRDHFLDNDTLIGTGIFTDGRLTFSGMNIELPAESLSYFFVTAACPLDAIDADSLAAIISGASEFGFAELANVNGDLPLTRGGYMIVDGSIAAQYRLHPLTSRSLNPGDSDVVVLALQPAFNGDQTDTLTGFVIKNSLDADNTDLTSVRLWADLNADGQWQATDSLLGTLDYVADSWQASGLTYEIKTGTASLIVTATVTDTARSGRAFRPYIDRNGCTFESGNDGPIDVPVTSNATFTISSSALQVQYGSLRRTYSVGETIVLTLNVSNLLGVPLDSVFGEVSLTGDATSLVPDSSHGGPIRLEVDSSGTFAFFYTAVQPGDVVFKSRAIAKAAGDSSAVIETDNVAIQAIPSGLRVSLHNYMPTAVARGQQNVFPLSLGLSHADATGAAPIFVKSVTFSVLNSSGDQQPADSVFSRLLLADDNSTLSTLTAIPGTSTVTMFLEPNLLLNPGDTSELVLLVDIADSALATSLVLGIESSEAVDAVDANTDLTVTMLPSVVLPLRTASCRIDDPTTALAVSNVVEPISAVNAGQLNVPMLRLGVRHPGVTGMSQVQVVGLSLMLVSGVDTLFGSSITDRVAVYRSSELLGQATGVALDRKMIAVDLGSGLTLNPGAVDSLVVAISVSAGIASDSFQVVIPDSSLVEVRDVASGSQVTAVTDQEVLATGSVFPVVSSTVGVFQPAREVAYCLSDDLPSSVVAGSDSVPLLSVSLNYDQLPVYAPVRVSRLSLLLLDSLGTPLDPGQLLDRTAYRIGTAPAQYYSTLTLANGATIFPLGDTGVVIEPSSSIDIGLLADFESDNPYDNFRVVLDGVEAMGVEDAIDPMHIPMLQVAEQCLSVIPYQSRVVSIFMPAGAPRLDPGDYAVRIASPGQEGFTIGTESFAYTGAIQQGEIEFQSLSAVLYRYDRNSETVVPASSVFSSVYLSHGENRIAVDSVLNGDTIHLAVDPMLVLAHGTIEDVSLLADISRDIAPGNYRVKLVDSSSVVLRDKNLGSPVYPILSTGSFPVTLGTISVSASNLKSSFSNFPNPFTPVDGATTIAYVLTEDAHVDIELFTITGEPVAQIADNAFRTAGPHQDETWNGLNDAGLRVVPGTYFCRITARYTSGETESARRKVSVVR